MKVVLLVDVKKIGRRGETKDVADGFAYNFLIPQKKGVRADSADAKKFLESLKDLADKHSADEKKLMKLFSESEVIIQMKAKTNEKGHLYKAVTAKEINEEFIKIYPGLPSIEMYTQVQPLKEAGKHSVFLVIGKEKIPFTVTI